MCGRDYRQSDKQKIAETFHVAKWAPDVHLAPDYNIAPSTFEPILRSSPDQTAQAEDGRYGRNDACNVIRVHKAHGGSMPRQAFSPRNKLSHLCWTLYRSITKSTDDSAMRALSPI
jgi:hypothetical protein